METWKGERNIIIYELNPFARRGIPEVFSDEQKRLYVIWGDETDMGQSPSPNSRLSANQARSASTINIFVASCIPNTLNFRITLTNY
jgi:hypothetical protein